MEIEPHSIEVELAKKLEIVLDGLAYHIIEYHKDRAGITEIKDFESGLKLIETIKNSLINVVGERMAKKVYDELVIWLREKFGVSGK